MQWLQRKNIRFIFFSAILLGNVFVTFSVHQSVHAETCHVKTMHTNPCSFVQVGETFYEMPQQIDAHFDGYHLPSVEEGVPPLVPLLFTHFFAHETDIPLQARPPSRNELARSHLS